MGSSVPGVGNLSYMANNNNNDNWREISNSNNGCSNNNVNVDSVRVQYVRKELLTELETDI